MTKLNQQSTGGHNFPFLEKLDRAIDGFNDSIPGAVCSLVCVHLSRPAWSDFMQDMNRLIITGKHEVKAGVYRGVPVAHNPQLDGYSAALECWSPDKVKIFIDAATNQPMDAPPIG